MHEAVVYALGVAHAAVTGVAAVLVIVAAVLCAVAWAQYGATVLAVFSALKHFTRRPDVPVRAAAPAPAVVPVQPVLSVTPKASNVTSGRRMRAPTFGSRRRKAAAAATKKE
jgi:hypothetical protein